MIFFECHSASILQATFILSLNITPITNLSMIKISKYHHQYAIILLIFFASMQTPAQSRRNRIASIRASLQEIPVMKKNSIQNRISKRRMSLKLEGDPELKLIQEKFKQKEDNTVSLGKFNQKYELGQKIGEGSNGFVKKCFLRSTRELFAVKSIQTDQEHIMFLKANFKYIKELDHPNIVRYHFMYLDNKKNICNLVMDYDSHPCLLDYHNLNEDQIRQIMYQLLSTLAYIHSKNICHRDIKPENILYDRQNKKIKLIDFGISKKLQNRGYKKDMLTITGTLYYRAPQMFLGGGYDQKVDVWAAGVTLYQLLSHRRTPFESDFLSTTIENIIKGEVQYPDEPWNRYNKFAKDLVSRLLRKRQERLTAAEAKKHFWFEQNYDEGCIDLTKSDSTKIQFWLRKKQAIDHIDEQFKFERSLTNTFSTQTGQMPKGSQKGKNILKKWLADGSDDDVLIDVESEEEDEQNVAIETKN